MRVGWVLVAGASAAWAQGAPAKVRVAEVVERELQDHHRVTGSVRAAASADLAAQEEGQVIALEVDEGSAVKKGATICRLDARRLKLQKASMEAMFARARAARVEAQARLADAQSDLERSQKLSKSNSVTETQLKDDETAVAIGEAQLEAAERELDRMRGEVELLETRLSDTEVKAPFDGVVVQLHAEVGEWIRPGDPILTLISSDRLEVWLEVPERFAATAGSAESLQVEVGGLLKTLKARDCKVIPLVDTRARTFFLVGTLETEGALIAPGMSARAAVPTGVKRRWLTIPKDALIRDGIAPKVYKVQGAVNGGSQAVPIGVEVAFETAELVALASPGLAQGDKVVIEGNERLNPMAPVIPMTPDGRVLGGEGGKQ